mmetsp:Transcript_62631/g.198311  ORF Transcript_62631/g.198311 Transcript_62631/m.198311 type:complete len:215 (-) Transcript_62631:176-820(-)
MWIGMLESRAVFSRSVAGSESIFTVTCPLLVNLNELVTRFSTMRMSFALSHTSMGMSSEISIWSSTPSLLRLVDARRDFRSSSTWAPTSTSSSRNSTCPLRIFSRSSTLDMMFSMTMVELITMSSISRISTTSGLSASAGGASLLATSLVEDAFFRSGFILSCFALATVGDSSAAVVLVGVTRVLGLIVGALAAHSQTLASWASTNSSRRRATI